MMDREAFEQYLVIYGYHQNSFSKKEAGGIVEYVDARIDLLWQAWQACAAHCESIKKSREDLTDYVGKLLQEKQEQTAELNNALAVIEKQGEAAIDYLETTDKENWLPNAYASKVNLIKAPSLTPNNVRLVEVGTAKHGMISFSKSLPWQETKLYTIEKGE
jgi:hypothetical protein